MAYLHVVLNFVSWSNIYLSVIRYLRTKDGYLLLRQTNTIEQLGALYPRVQNKTRRWFSIMSSKRKLNYGINLSLNNFFCRIALNPWGLFHFQGCKEKLKTVLKDALYVVGAIGVTIVVIQVRSKDIFSYNISILPRRKAGRTMKVIKWEKNKSSKISELSLKSMCHNHSVMSTWKQFRMKINFMPDNDCCHEAL